MDNNDGGNDPVARAVAGLRHALQDLRNGRNRVNTGAQAIGDEGHQNANVAEIRTWALSDIGSSMVMIVYLMLRIEEAVRRIEAVDEDRNTPLYTIAVAIGLVNSIARSIHGYLVFNLEARLDLDGYRDVQEGLALINISLRIFHMVLAYFHGNVAPAAPVVGGLGGGDVAGAMGGDVAAAMGSDFAAAIDLVPCDIVFKEAMVSIMGASDVIEQGNHSITQGVIIFTNLPAVPDKILGALQFIQPCLVAITEASTFVGDTIGRIIADFEQGADTPDAAHLTAIVQVHTSINFTVVALHSAVLAFSAAELSDRAQSKLHMGLVHYHQALLQIQDALRQMWAAN